MNNDLSGPPDKLCFLCPLSLKRAADVAIGKSHQLQKSGISRTAELHVNDMLIAWQGDFNNNSIN